MKNIHLFTLSWLSWKWFKIKLIRDVNLDVCRFQQSYMQKRLVFYIFSDRGREKKMHFVFVFFPNSYWDGVSFAIAKNGLNPQCKSLIVLRSISNNYVVYANLSSLPKKKVYFLCSWVGWKLQQIWPVPFKKLINI